MTTFCLPGTVNSVADAESRTSSEAKRIHLFGDPDAFGGVAEGVSALGYEIVASSARDGFRPANYAGGAAIVSGAEANALELCSELAAFCPVLLTTMDATFDYALAAARSGVRGLLIKPYEPTEILDWLNDLIGAQQQAQMSVLIVDDDLILAEAYALAFEAADIGATVVTDPRKALDALATWAPDIVLLDMEMPGVDGLDLARIIRQSRKFLSLPIVFLSAERDPERQFEARRLGGDDFIAKPVNLRQLVSLVRMRAERAVALRSMMERDSLTGLYNHARFKERLNHELERCRRTGVELSLVLIDLDEFKCVNDTYGHLTGDKVIRAIAHTLAMGLRRIDIVGRLGGEEFGVLLLDTPTDAALAVIDKLRARFGEIAFESAGRSFSVTFSGGLSGSREHGQMNSLLEATDAALYAAKSAGRNRIVAEAPPLRA
ncbi:MAG: diguanylate cyclase [Hansschlegelia sp.]